MMKNNPPPRDHGPERSKIPAYLKVLSTLLHFKKKQIGRQILACIRASFQLLITIILPHSPPLTSGRNAAICRLYRYIQAHNGRYRGSGGGITNHSLLLSGRDVSSSCRPGPIRHSQTRVCIMRLWDLTAMTEDKNGRRSLTQSFLAPKKSAPSKRRDGSLSHYPFSHFFQWEKIIVGAEAERSQQRWDKKDNIRIGETRGRGFWRGIRQ